jgi:hypothetical protein
MIMLTLLQVIAEIKEPAADSDPMTTPKQTKGRKPKANLHNLPVGTAVKFGSMYIPLIKAYIGFQLPWADPEIPVLIKHWTNVYGKKLAGGWEKDDPVRLLVCFPCI